MRSIFVSYDGALDPLGATQVIPYLLGLAAAGVQIALVSFEKADRWASAGERLTLQSRLRAAGIDWHPLRYHRTPRIPATLLDVVCGAAAIRRRSRAQTPAIVHCRGDVAMVMARWARPTPGTSLLYDVRGFFSDERVEGGSWKPGSVLDRAVRRLEAGNLRSARGLVVLTQAALDVLVERRAQPPPYRVIPTCAATDVFHPPTDHTPRRHGLVYSGSLGSVYMTEEIVAFARMASPLLGRTLFLTPHVDLARRSGATASWADVKTVTPEQVPHELRTTRAAFFFCRPGPGRRASFPTKLAEALATGLPVVANRGIGDLDRILEQESVGVLVDDHTPAAHQHAIQDLSRLLADAATTGRCRRLAETRYSLAVGVSSYKELYEELARGRT